MNTAVRVSLQAAFLTVLTLFGGLFAGGIVGTIIYESLPGHSVTNPRAVHVLLGALPAVGGLLAGSGAWGWSMAGLARSQDRRRMVMAGIVGFVPITVVLALVLLRLEGIIAQIVGSQLPIHRVFTLLFVPSAFLIAGISTWAVGKGLGDDELAKSLLWRVGTAAALAFLVVNLVMETSGWVVGAPGAAQRNTMLTVMLAGNLGSALVGGAVLGWILATSARVSSSQGGVD